MTDLCLRTRRLLLVPGSERDLNAALKGPAALAKALGVDVPTEWPPQFYDDDAVRYTLDSLRRIPDHGGWTFYYLLLHATDERRATAIGTGGFKAPPDEQGEVELGYGVLPSYQRQGYATEAVHAMTDFAFADPRVQAVVGQTLPSLIPSIGVLEKAGFVFDGEGSDPQVPTDQTVLRYVLTRERYVAQ